MQAKKESISTALCERVRILAADKRMTNLDLAKKADISYRTVYSVMKGAANLQDRIVSKLAAALDVSTQYLLTGEGEKRVAPMMVREGCVYPERGDAEQIPDRLHRAGEVIAEQLNIPKGEVLDAVCDLAKKKLEAEAKGA
jgi:transcriptional regulator with XRE-family HTH domain